ncbi:MAG: 4Fe-4S binding protein [Deltaproteobacteria bacterium]|nr:4Fe-4S binding protein [Deltaproteobacteria bacterium]
MEHIKIDKLGRFGSGNSSPLALVNDEEKRGPIEKGLEKFLVKNRDKFAYIHFAMFIVFLLFYLVPPFLPLPAEDATPLDNYFLFVKFAVWGLWFPLLLLSIIFFGRAWCGIFCPQGAAGEYFNKRNGKSRSLPKWIKWEGTPIASFIIITILGQTIGVRDYPKPMLLLFGGTTVIAAFIGYRYTKGFRGWCRHLCPVGILLGIFSRLGMVEIKKGDLGGLKTACPTYINLSTKSSARHCIECMRCVNPESKGTLHFKLRSPGKEIEQIRSYEPHIYEVAFLFLATGLALGGFYWITSPLFVQFKGFMGGLMLQTGLVSLIGQNPPWWLGVNYPEAGDVFNWLDVIAISSFMILFMIITGLALFMLTTLSSLLMEEKGKTVMEKVTILGYAYAPVALLSLILGLGAELFALMEVFNVSSGFVRNIRISILTVAVTWSIYLHYKLTGKRILPTLPNSVGALLVMGAWYPVI